MSSKRICPFRYATAEYPGIANTADVETVGNIQKSIGESGKFVASIQSTDRVADRINSRIQIREAGS